MNQPREHAVPCSACGHDTWNPDALCRHCRDRRCSVPGCDFVFPDHFGRRAAP